MAEYIIGDVQGCFDDLMRLLNEIKFNPDQDHLYFCGDVVNRGGQSLQVLRWIYAHQNHCSVTLGNHDLSLLAQYYVPKIRKFNNVEFQEIYEASDCQLLMSWLLRQPLLITLKQLNTTIVHAGIYPGWTLETARREAQWTESIIRGNPQEFFSQMYGTQPSKWDDQLKGMDRARFTINTLTRMRFIEKNGSLNFKAKGEVSDFPKLKPWFLCEESEIHDYRIVFGHWSALGFYNKKNITCLDTGKVWGGKLTAVRIGRKKYHIKKVFQV